MEQYELTDFTTHRLEKTDIGGLLPVLQHWVRDGDTGEVVSSEIDEILQRFQTSIDRNNPDQYSYLVVRTPKGQAVGVMGYRSPEEAMRTYVHEETPTVEMVNVFLHPDYTGRGLGKKLVLELLANAASEGFVEMVWNSGPRYRDTAWKFYVGIFGEPEEIAIGFYGEGYDAPIWRTTLRKSP